MFATGQPDQERKGRGVQHSPQLLCSWFLVCWFSSALICRFIFYLFFFILSFVILISPIFVSSFLCSFLFVLYFYSFSFEPLVCSGSHLLFLVHSSVICFCFFFFCSTFAVFILFVLVSFNYSFFYTSSDSSFFLSSSSLILVLSVIVSFVLVVFGSHFVCFGFICPIFSSVSVLLFLVLIHSCLAIYQGDFLKGKGETKLHFAN